MNSPHPSENNPPRTALFVQVEAIARILEHVDATLGVVILPIAAWILLSGLDDLFVDAVWIASRLSPKSHRPLPQHDLEPLTAIFVPMWDEHEVIRSMVDHNRAAIDYRNYHFFLGAYPNDARTLDECRETRARRTNLHLAICPHDGPTSKADCLNWIYQHMALFEENQACTSRRSSSPRCRGPDPSAGAHGHQSALEAHDMVQVPVLALPTPLSHWTHGLYCDEFAEYQTRDMPVREAMGGFCPPAASAPATAARRSNGWRRTAITASSSPPA